MTISVFLLAAISPLLYAATNHLDNILLEKYFKQGGVGTLILFSGLLSILALPIFYLIEPNILGATWFHLAILIAVGFINTLLLWSYLKALFADEPTVVIIYYQLVPVIALLFGYFILGETITTIEGWAMSTIIIGALILTVALDDNGKIEFRTKTFFYMLIASVCWALESTLFKLVALEENVWRSLFWEHAALVSIAILIFLFIPSYRKNFSEALRLNSKPILGLNVMNESMYMIGNSIAAYVVVLIPVSITLLMNSFQPLFVLILGIALKLLLPNLDVEHVNGRNLLQKIFAIALTGVGVYLLGNW